MSVLGFLIPVAILGLIAWVVIGFTKARGAEPFTLATATALYSRVMFIAGVLMSLAGLGIIIKAGFGFITPAYSYFTPMAISQLCPPNAACPSPYQYQFTFYDQQRSQDLVLGITLVGIGVLVAGVHLFLGRAVARMPGGAPSWPAVASSGRPPACGRPGCGRRRWSSPRARSRTGPWGCASRRRGRCCSGRR